MAKNNIILYKSWKNCTEYKECIWISKNVYYILYYILCKFVSEYTPSLFKFYRTFGMLSFDNFRACCTTALTQLLGVLGQFRRSACIYTIIHTLVPIWVHTIYSKNIHDIHMVMFTSRTKCIHVWFLHVSLHMQVNTCTDIHLCTYVYVYMFVYAGYVRYALCGVHFLHASGQRFKSNVKESFTVNKQCADCSVVLLNILKVTRHQLTSFKFL